MRELEKTLRAFANRRRLTILKHLKDNREARVGDIARAIRLSFKATSRHLAILHAADILEKEQRSLEVFYCLASAQSPTARHIISLL